MKPPRTGQRDPLPIETAAHGTEVAPVSRRRVWQGLGVVLCGLVLGGGLLAWLNLRHEQPVLPDSPAQLAALASPTLIERGAYLARAGNCEHCHTARGGARYAGGRAIATPFGTVMAGNLTPDADTGLGRWSSSQFWRALHHGRSADGRLLVPAFPYPHFTLITRDDADALWGFLRNLSPVRQANAPHALRWPYGTQAALALWRTLYFSPAGSEAQAPGDLELQRGAYLVNGLGHCSACHARHNLVGASGALSSGQGGQMPGQPWLAPSLTDPTQPGIAGHALDERVQLLKTGVSAQASVLGPMAEVVAGSTQHLSQQDLRSMVRYLQSLAPSGAPAAPIPATDRPAPVLALGAELYSRHCADCHGAQGQGAPGIYPPLAGSRTVTMVPPNNLVLAITQGGFPPATDGNPRPYGMPAFDLSHDELAALTTWLRASWGHDAPALSAVDILLLR